MNKKIENIIIFGGGTSGWLTASYLTANLRLPTKITLIEDASAGPIGVGEGTQPLTAQFLYACGLDPKQWMQPSNASFKFGVELTGWNEDPYFVDNDSVNNYMPTTGIFTSDYFIGKPYKEFAKWHPAYRLAKANKSPKMTELLDHNYNQGLDGYGAVHFGAYDIITALKDLLGDKIEYVDTKISSAETDENGITKLIDEEGKEYSADLYLDCSGFKSQLLEKTLGSEFVDYKKEGWLLNNNAVAIPTQYTNPEEECHPYTKATTMTCGWRWTIPTYARIGNGYVYDSDFISPEDAEKELREAIGDFDTPAKHLQMKCGTHKEIALKNVCGIGLAGGFVEPLEATGITFTTGIVKSLCDLLNIFGSNWNQQVTDNLNQGWYEMCVEILTFVWSHYYFSQRSDTPYWKKIREKTPTELPSDAQFMLNQYFPELKRFLFFSKQSMFSSQQWFSMLHAGGAYKSFEGTFGHSGKVEEYIEDFLKQQTDRVDNVIKKFPNQYTYLKDWYEGWTVD